MTIEKRLELLVQSTESLCASTQALHATVVQHNIQIATLVRVAEQNERRWLRAMRMLRDSLDAALNEGSEGGNGGI